MRGNDRNSKNGTKKRKEKSKKPTTPKELYVENYWPKVVISRDERIFRDAEQTSKTISASFFEKDVPPKRENPKENACDIVELLYCNGSGSNFQEEKTTCLISSSTEEQGNTEEVCASCRDCVECHKQKRNAEVAEEVEESDSSKTTEINDFNYNEEGTAISESLDSTTGENNEPIFVDLTTDEKSMRKQTILKRFCESNDLGNTSENNGAGKADYVSTFLLVAEPRIMIADSSSRLHRAGTGGSLATALRDRGPCVIPVQPNRSLPIRPAPHTPISSSRKDRSPLLKLSKIAIPDVVEVEPIKSIVPPTNGIIDEKSAVGFEEQNQERSDILTTDYALPRISGLRCLGGLKRKIDEDKEHERESGKENRKRKKSHEADSSETREERVESSGKEFPKNFCVSLSEKERMGKQIEVWTEKKCPATGVGSTTEDSAEKDKESNKIVPPLRLKKVVRSETEGYGSSEISAEMEQESNYRIVTGATPRPESRSISTGISSSSSNAYYDSLSSFEITPETVDARGARRSSAKTDGHKLKYRRNSLKQKLRELRGKALELADEMANPSTTDDSSPQRITKLRQAMNRYEKQIENLSKLLSKLSAAIPTAGDIVDVNDDNETHLEKSLIVESAQESKKGSVKRISPVSSPEPPKLSPRLPLDYDKDKSLVEERNSPPVLPRVCLIVPSILDSTEDDLQIPGTKIWTPDDESPKLMIDTGSLEDLSSDQTCEDYGNEHAQVTPTIPLTVNQSARSNVVNVDGDKSDFGDNKGTMELNDSNEANRRDDNDEKLYRGQREKVREESGSTEASTSDRPMDRRQEKVGRGALTEMESGFRDSIMTSVGGPSNASTSTRNGGVFGPIASTTSERHALPARGVTNSLQLPSNYYVATVAGENVLYEGVVQDNRRAQKVTSSSNKSVAPDDPSAQVTFCQLNDSVGTTSNQEHVAMQKNKGEGNSNDPTQRHDDNRIMAEQFPTLGNWVARMSKKQVSKSKSKLQSANAAPVAPTESTSRIPLPAIDAQKAAAPSTSHSIRNNIVNVAPQWNTERWQRQQHQQQRQQQHQQQRQQQQLLQQVGVTPTSSQPLPPPAGPLRPGICPPISMPQYYPNSYAIDPYSGAALGYHSTMCPYGPYPYHSRLHPGSPLPSYHLPLQDPMTSPLRPLPHMDKRFTPLQEPIRHYPPDMVKYPGSLLTGGFQRPVNNPSTAAYLPSLFLPPNQPPAPQPPPTSLPSAPRTLPQTPLAGYSANNNQFTQNRMMPDVVAAAAAAAVVAAASFDRQHGGLTSYSRTEADVTPSTGLGNVTGGEASRPVNCGTSGIAGRGLSSQTQNVVLTEDNRLNGAGYQQLQNLLYDRLKFVRTADNFAQTSTFHGSDGSAAAVGSNIPYRTSSIIGSHSQPAKDGARGEARSCETPHLGKVNRDPNTLCNFACSNCGVTGSMFKCLGCETVFYCDERCQTRHWNVHVEKCPKKMPKLKKVT